MPSAVADGHTQEGGHIRMVFRKTHPARIFLNVGNADGLHGVHQGTDQAEPARRVLHARNFFRRHAAGDKLFQLTVCANHAQGGIACPGLLLRHFHNTLQERFNTNFAHQFQAGVMQGQ